MRESVVYTYLAVLALDRLKLLCGDTAVGVEPFLVRVAEGTDGMGSTQNARATPEDEPKNGCYPERQVVCFIANIQAPVFSLFIP